MPSGSGAGASSAPCKQHLKLSFPIWKRLALAAGVAAPAGFNPAALDRVNHRVICGMSSPLVFRCSLLTASAAEIWVQPGGGRGDSGSLGRWHAQHQAQPEAFGSLGDTGTV